MGSQCAPLFEAEHIFVVPGAPQSRRQAAGLAVSAFVSPPSAGAISSRVVNTVAGAARIVTAWRRRKAAEVVN